MITTDTSVELKSMKPKRTRGTTAGQFRFGSRRERIDWRLLHGIDLEKLVRLSSHTTYHVQNQSY